jgi:hypothetical protein
VDLIDDLGVADVQIGLLGVEAVQVVHPGLVVPLPVRVLRVGEDDVLFVVWAPLEPDVPVAIPGVRVAAGRLEPRVLV